MRRIVTAFLLVLAVGACGLPSDSGPDVATDDEVPFDLLEPESATTSTTPTGIEVDLYFVGPFNLLTLVVRSVERTPSLTELVEELSTPPDAPVVRTTLDDELVDEIESRGGIARVELTEDFLTLSVSDQVLALGQIVYTLTARPGVGRVAFLLEGEPVPIPRGDGTVTTDSVSREAYAVLVSP